MQRNPVSAEFGFFQIARHGLDVPQLDDPVLVVGLLVVGAAGLLWRAVCEFYVAIFRIGDDLAALRKVAEAEAAKPLPAEGYQNSGINR